MMQNKNYIKVTSILLLASLTVGCGTKVQENTNTSVISDVKYFETNTNTISRYTIIKDGDEENDSVVSGTSGNSYSTITDSPSDEIGEITLTGEDTSKDYTLSEDGSVTYKGVTYQNLYNVINSVDTKYDKNTLLNFIIKKIDMGSTQVYCDIRENYSSDDEDSEEGDMVGEPIDDGIIDNPTYTKAVSKYGSYITWIITLMNLDNRSEARIYGCYDYFMINYLGSDVEVDMSQYDTTGSHVTTDEETQTTEQPETEEQQTEITTEQIEETQSTDDLEDTNNEN
jgi:hypothetical protein